jgi:putative transposase
MSQTTLPTTFKEKLRPTAAQERAFDTVVWRCRDLYNAALEQRITAYHRRHVSVSRFDQEAELKEIRAAFPDYEAIHSHVLQDVLARLNKTYQAFFRRIQRGEKAGFLRFQGTPNTVTISREADGWYMAISCADAPVHPVPPTGQETGIDLGIDLGIEAFATLSDGQRILTPGYYRRAERYRVKCQRRVAQRKQGSHRRRKAVNLLAKAHQTVRRQRADFHHKTALQLVRENDTIYHEDLQVRNMVKNHHLAKSSADAGWAAVLAILVSKAACAGRQVIAVHPAFTSQTCSGCGVVVSKGLSVRWHACPECGTELHRDHTAAKHIQCAGSACGDSRGRLRG